MKTITRRTFIKYCAYAGAGVLLQPGLVSAESFKEEKQKEKLARYHFNFSSPYYTAMHRTTPHAHAEIKEAVERHTQNKVYVNIHDGGSMGIGSSLANSVRFNESQGALISVSNISPMINEFDILNIPFWSAGEDEYIRLFNSQLWKQYVVSKTRAFNIKVLFHYVVGARTASSTRLSGKLIKAPEDFKNTRFRIPGSKSLAVFYKLARAETIEIPWRLCARTARKGRYEALDPCVIGLYSGPEELNKELGIISNIESVHDGWLAIGNRDFIDSLDPKTRIEFLDAFAEIQTLQIKLYQKAKDFCSTEFARLGTKIYMPTPQEKAVLSESFGHHHPAWEPVKKRLLGENGMAVFDQLYKTARG